MLLSFVTSLPLPNEDFGNKNKPFRVSVANKKVALSALGEILLRKVVKKVDNAKIRSYATI